MKRDGSAVDSRELAGDSVYLTGASSGIGKAAALRLIEAGAEVAGVARTASKLEQTRSEAASLVGEDRFIPLVGDVTREGEVQKTFRQAVESFGKVDIVLANAGSMRVAEITETSLALWEEMFAVLSRGVFLTARAAFRYWLEEGIPGRLVITSSKNAVAASPGASAYAAAKAAAQHLARCLAEEGGPHGIRTNTVLPGAVIQGTNILSQDELEKSAERHGVAPDEIEEYYRHRNALNVSLQPEDVAEAMLFLSSPRSRMLNGAALTVDGGISTSYLR